MTERRNRSTRLRGPHYLLPATFGIIALLAIAELALQFWAHHLRVPYERYDADRATPTLVPGKHTTPFGVIEIDAQGFTARAPQDTARSADGILPAFRIVALGDSCTFGAGDSETTYPVALERRFHARERAPFDYQVVNAGIAGLTSDEAVGRLAYSLEVLKPDLVTIYLGWNDLMKLAPRSQTRAAPFSTLWRAIDQLWLVRGLRKLLFFQLRAQFGDPKTGPESATGRFANFHPTYFEENLRRLIADTRTAGARPILVTLPHSLRRDLSPTELVGRHRQYPYFYSGNALGDFVDLIERYNETIREVGRAEAVPVADVALRFDRMTRKEDYFFDTMHPNRRGNVLIAEVLERSLRENDLLQRPSHAERPAVSE